MTLKVIAFGNYIPEASGHLRGTLTEMLLRLKGRAEDASDSIEVYTSNLDEANGLIMRTARALSIPVFSIDGKEMLPMCKDVDGTYIIALKIVSDTKDDALSERLEHYAEYVNLVLERLDAECPSNIVNVSIPETTLAPRLYGASDLSEYRKKDLPDLRTGDYSDIRGYVDNWFDGVRRPKDIPTIDTKTPPPKDTPVDTRKATRYDYS